MTTAKETKLPPPPNTDQRPEVRTSYARTRAAAHGMVEELPVGVERSRQVTETQSDHQATRPAAGQHLRAESQICNSRDGAQHRLAQPGGRLRGGQHVAEPDNAVALDPHTHPSAAHPEPRADAHARRLLPPRPG